MIISEKGRFIFVHVQKNAGTSIEKILEQNFLDSKCRYGRHERVINGIQEIGRDEWNKYFSFAFVRNPWDRLVSWYSMIQEKKTALPADKRVLNAPFDSPFWNHVVHDSHDFESFLINCTDVIFDGGCLKSYAFNQVDYLSDENGEIAVTFVGRFENLADDISKIFDRLDIKVGRLPTWNMSRHDHYSHYYTQETRNLVARRFRRDIEIFGYQFEEPR
ncbi:MAG: sulfotransferase family protein [Gammaproteobacteria bacterium]|nr:sulfotransferase family protein [Gammaproteobacteria bacterium]